MTGIIISLHVMTVIIISIVIIIIIITSNNIIIIIIIILIIISAGLPEPQVRAAVLADLRGPLRPNRDNYRNNIKRNNIYNISEHSRVQCKST